MFPITGLVPDNFSYQDNFISINNPVKDFIPTSVLAIKVDDMPENDINAPKVAKNAKKEVFCSCIRWAKTLYAGLSDKLISSPKFLWNHYTEFQLQRFKEPMPNFLVITKENLIYWHIGIVLEKTATEIVILENNFIPCVTATRSLDVNSNLIVGYLY